MVGPNAFHIYLTRNPLAADGEAATPDLAKGGRRPTVSHSKTESLRSLLILGCGICTQVRTGRPGRPAKGRPRAADVKRRADQARIELIHERAVQLASSSSNAPGDGAGSGGSEAGEDPAAPARKRVRYSRTYSGTTESRRTRSSGEAHTLVISPQKQA